ncbi:unnamed protein product, partial [Allacma fusca]
MAMVGFCSLDEWSRCNGCYVKSGIVRRGSPYSCSLACYLSSKAGRAIRVAKKEIPIISALVFSNPGKTMVMEFPTPVSALSVELHRIYINPVADFENTLGTGVPMDGASGGANENLIQGNESTEQISVPPGGQASTVQYSAAAGLQNVPGITEGPRQPVRRYSCPGSSVLTGVHSNNIEAFFASRYNFRRF